MNKSNIQSTSFPEYWEEAYGSGEIAWDLGGYTPVFNSWANTLTSSHLICILGAGNGWDAINLAKKGHKVTAIDFARQPIENMQIEAKKNNVKLDIVQSNIFNLPKRFNNYFDIVLEYTCFCAIDPGKRSDYAKLVCNMLKPDGLFVALLFPLNKNNLNEGPPYHVDLDTTLSLFDYYMIKQTCIKHPLSIEKRKDREIFIIYKKNGN